MTFERTGRKWLGCVATSTIFVLLAGVSTGLSGQQPSEYDVKAAFLYNFAKFVEWPAQAFPNADSPFTICLASDPFGGTLDKIVQGESLEGRPLVVRRISPTDVNGCQIVYVGAARGRAAEETIKAAENQPILTVGESENFISTGGIIRFIRSGGHVHFQINPDAATRVSLKVSSKLLRLAEIVRTAQHPGGIA